MKAHLTVTDDYGNVDHYEVAVLELDLEAMDTTQFGGDIKTYGPTWIRFRGTVINRERVA